MKGCFFTLVFITLFFTGFARAQELLIIQSPNLKCNDSIRVYTPDSITVSDKIPTLFLLHGWSGNYKNWGDKYDLQAVSNKTGFRIITPDGFYNSWYLNNTNKDSMQWRTFFDEELFPLVRSKYNIQPNTTFITGLSMGGHGAINLFLDNPCNFRSAGSMSGVLDLQLTSLKNTELAKVLGNKPQRIESENAINRLDTLVGINKPIIITCGYDDVYSKCTELFSVKCREKKIPHILMLTPGTHSWKYWGYALDEHLNFFRKLLENDNLGY